MIASLVMRQAAIERVSAPRGVQRAAASLRPGKLLFILLTGVLARASAVGGAQDPGAAVLTLSEALDRAARNNETTGIAEARVDRARAIRREAYATLLPDLTLSGTYTRRSREVTRKIDDERVVVQALDALNGVATVDLSLFDARTFPVAKSATRRLQAQELDSSDLKRGLAFEVAESFFAVLSAERLRGATNRRIQVAEATVSDARTKLEAGLASQNEVTRVELELASARLARTQAENAVRTTRLLLGYLIGVEVERPLAEPPAEAVPRDPPEEMTRRAEEARPDLKASELRAESQRLLAQEPLLRIFPTLGLRGTYRGTNEAGLSGRETDWNVAATLTWALFDGGVRYAQAAARRAEFREAALSTDALRRRVGLEIQTATADLDTAQAALEQAEVRARVADQNAEEVRVRFGEGLATALEQADAAVSAFEAEAELARQRFALRLAQLSLLRALGRWPREPEPAGSGPPLTEAKTAP